MNRSIEEWFREAEISHAKSIVRRQQAKDQRHTRVELLTYTFIVVVIVACSVIFATQLR